MTPLEFANVLQLTSSLREASWDKDNSRYNRDWHTCAEQALQSLEYSIEWATPISVMLFPEYADVWEWVEQIKARG